ncbi:hypothetical protein F2Q70_00031072 [Brassica cretica]|uniref:RNase H type-1 domain-containing protein n=1 Tax=Brassica cretica TaxID=69181 RepID=A0A8S9FKM8_BRACR|nr:hypothetical protein F2Q70_00031072 [Brassica cretica]
MNSFIFEGKTFEAEEIVVKAKQVQSGMELEEEKVVSVTVPCSLQNVPVGWVQCEFAMDWASRGESMGASWIVKDEKGKVLEHSRRVFVEVRSLTEAKLQLWLWVLESMRSLKKKKFEVGEIKRELQAFEAWELRIGSWNTIRCAFFIAQSVRNLGLTQSYNVPVGWVQCEFAMDWASRGESMGASWIVKDEKGKVLEHSRLAFVEVGSLTEAKLQLWLWVLESMRSLKKTKVRFVSSFGDLIEAIEKPSFWPALQFEVGEIKRELQAFEAWELRIRSWNTIRCAFFIAQSVRNLGLTQSYVAAGHPRWLDLIYANDRSASGGN